MESLLAYKLISLNKNLGLRRIGVGEVLRRIPEKVVMMVSKKDNMKATGLLQVCAGQESGAEVAIHAIYKFIRYS